MGFRYRKSIKAGPFRLNFSRSGIGYSIGGKFFRYTKKANGGIRKTMTIPGTGISYVQDSTESKYTKPQTNTFHVGQNIQGGNSMKPKNKIVELLLCLFLGWAGAHKFYMGKKGMGILYLFTAGLFAVGWLGDCISLCVNMFKHDDGSDAPKTQKVLPYIAGFLCVALAAGCSPDSEQATTPTEPTVAVIATTEATDVPTTEGPTEVTTEPTEAPTTEATTETTTEPVTEASTTEPEGSDYVLNTNSRKFHYPSCSSTEDIKDSNRKDVVATREELIEQGYEPCGNCHP